MGYVYRLCAVYVSVFVVCSGLKTERVPTGRAVHNPKKGNTRRVTVAVASRGTPAGDAGAVKLHAVASRPVLKSGANSSYEARYQRFMDYWPVTRYNHFEKFRRVTKYGVHKFPSTNLKPPRLLTLFDWTFTGNFNQNKTSNPRTFYFQAHPEKVRRLLEAVKNFDTNRSDRVLVLAGDTWLSEVFGDDNTSNSKKTGLDYRQHVRSLKPKMTATITKLRKYFGRIFFEAKDMHLGGIKTMPIGLTEFNLRRQDVFETAWPVIDKVTVDEASKPNSVLAAFGIYHDLQHCERGWGEAKNKREQALAWSRSPAAVKAGVFSGVVDPLEWWAKLASHKFLMSPVGCGVQAPKQLEGLMALTIPIHQRNPYPVWDDLLSYGFPIVVVDEWNEITPENLTIWWKRLSPRLESFRRNCLTTEGYWRLFTGEVEYCE